MANTKSNLIINITCILIILAVIKLTAGFINLILLAICFAIIVRSSYSRLKSLRVSKWLAILIILFGVSFFIFFIGAVFVNTYNQFNQNLAYISEQFISRVESLINLIKPILGYFGIHEFNFSNLTDQLNFSRYLSIANTVISSASDILGNLLFITLTAFFILFDATNLTQRLNIILASNPSLITKILNIFTNVSIYIERKFYVSLVTAIAVFILSICFGVKFALMWAVLTFFFNFIPNIGVFIVSALMILQMFILESSFTLALSFSGCLIALHFYSGNIFEPRIMAKYLNLSTMIVWLSLVFWSYILGPTGALLSIPLTTTAKSLLEMSSDYYKLGFLMEEGTPNSKDKT